MKTKALLVSILMGLTTLAGAAWYYNGILANDAALAANKTYVFDVSKVPSDTPVNRISAQAVYAISGSTAAYAGNVSMAWYASNNGVNYSPMAVSSATYLQSASTTTATSTIWDFGIVDYRYLQLAVIAPSGGTLNLVVTVHGKN